MRTLDGPSRAGTATWSPGGSAPAVPSVAPVAPSRPFSLRRSICLALAFGPSGVAFISLLASDFPRYLGRYQQVVAGCTACPAQAAPSNHCRRLRSAGATIERHASTQPVQLQCMPS